MANGRSGNTRTIGYIVGGVVLILILAWLFGLFGGDDGLAEVDGDAAIVTEDGVVAGEDAEEALEEAADD